MTKLLRRLGKTPKFLAKTPKILGYLIHRLGD